MNSVISLINDFLTTSPFIPHGHCYLWKPGLVWLHVLSDSLIAIAYYSIPITLFYFVRRREDLPFSWIFLLFATFIISCGTTHILEVWTLWYPTYWVSGAVKAFTAIVSLWTALELIPLIPLALALPSPAQLEQTNRALELQIQERRKIEEELRQSQSQLERRVQERTAALVEMNQQLEQEIQERQKAEAQREQLLEREQIARTTAESANRLKDEFLAVLSHEIRTPLNPILGWAKLLRGGKLDAEKTQIALETIERNAQLQTQLIDDLLDISRILRGKLSLNVDTVRLTQTIAAAQETVRLAAEVKEIQIITQLDPSPKTVMGDTNRLQQVIWNLLSNAVKFTPSGGRIYISLEYQDKQAKIQVQDTGKGIREDFLPYVFDSFRQADGTTTRNFGGLGLGLAIARQIVELHGGSIQAESPGEGMGATFTVQLPLSTGLTTPDQESAPYLSDLNLQNLEILLVDDAADTRELVSFILEQQGAAVTSVGSAQEGLAVFMQKNPDLLVSDIGMPEMDGYMLMEKVREWETQQGKTATPAIALTAYAGEYNAQQAITAGFDSHLSKPVNPQKLISTILRLIPT